MSVGPSKKLRDEGFFKFKQKAGDELCWVAGCQKATTGDRCLCSMHKARRQRSLRSREASYFTLRDHAKERNIEFDLSPDYWRGLTDAFGFWEVPHGHTLSVDRVDGSKGYVEGNIRIATHTDNVTKGNRERFLPAHVLSMLERKRSKMSQAHKKFLEMYPNPGEKDEEELPF